MLFLTQAFKANHSQTVLKQSKDKTKGKKKRCVNPKPQTKALINLILSQWVAERTATTTTWTRAHTHTIPTTRRSASRTPRRRRRRPPSVPTTSTSPCATPNAPTRPLMSPTTCRLWMAMTKPVPTITSIPTLTLVKPLSFFLSFFLSFYLCWVILEDSFFLYFVYKRKKEKIESLIKVWFNDFWVLFILRNLYVLVR